ncbi:MAG: ribonuclease P protein component [Candidatus Aegiribacteria sp.]|nr:ribonuclease P protein component [Candidatus Aegiribacteria sp.]
MDTLTETGRTLKKAGQFRRVFRTGNAFRGVSFRAVYVKNTLGFIRLGFSLSAKSGNAVRRNLIRRRIKGLANEKRNMVGADIVILPAGKLKDAKWPEIRDEFGKLISIIGNNSC